MTGRSLECITGSRATWMPIRAAVLALALVVAASAAPRITTAQGFYHGCWRHFTPEECAHTMAAGPKAAADSSGVDCARWKDALTAKIDALGKAWAQAVVDGHYPEAYELGRQYELALSDWDSLGKDCPDIGDPPPRPKVPTVQSSGAPGGTSASGGGSSGGGGGGGGGSSGGGTSAGPTSGTGNSQAHDSARTAAEIHLVELLAISGDSTASRIGGIPLWIGARARRHIDSTWSAIANAAASNDYSQPVTAEMPGDLPAPASATPLDQAGLAYANATRSEAVLLDAYLQSYERLLGARDAHDAGAMLRHAVAMVAFADALLTQGRTAAERRQIVLVLGAEALARMDSVRRAHHRTWDEAVRRSTAASTADAARVLGAAGVPSPMDSTVPRELARDADRAVRPDVLVRQVQVRVKADSMVRASFTDARYAATWPDPPDVASIAHARAFALKAVLQADSARQLASPSAASDSAGTGATAGPSSPAGRRRAWSAFVVVLTLGALGAGGALLRRRATARA